MISAITQSDLLCRRCKNNCGIGFLAFYATFLSLKLGIAGLRQVLPFTIENGITGIKYFMKVLILLLFLKMSEMLHVHK